MFREKDFLMKKKYKFETESTYTIFYFIEKYTYNMSHSLKFITVHNRKQLFNVTKT